jgi:hypothetical protein
MFMPNLPRTARFGSVLAPICLAIFLFLSPGCNSIYHRAGEEMSQDSRTRLATRIREARSCAVAAADLIGQYPPDSPALADRAESYSWDFSKAVASVHDVAARLNTKGDPVTDLIAALDRADQDLAAAVDPERSQGQALRPAFSLAEESLKDAIARADAYFGKVTFHATPAAH